MPQLTYAVLHIRIGPQELFGQTVWNVQPGMAEVAFLVLVHFIATRTKKIQKILLCGVTLVARLAEFIS